MNSLSDFGKKDDPSISKQTVDESGYNARYSNDAVDFSSEILTKEEYVEAYERRYVRPYYKGGWTFNGHATRIMLGLLAQHVAKISKTVDQVTILDAGSGLGHLSVYLACKGYYVHGVEIAKPSVEKARRLAERLGVEDRVTFYACSLEQIDLPNRSIDVIVGRNTLHHFIKYKNVIQEFQRIVRDDSIGLFVDPFGENVFKNLFQNKKRMKQLGDELLTKKSVEAFFHQLTVQFLPMQWFGLFDKLLKRNVIFGKWLKLRRKLSALFYRLDQMIPANNRLALWFAGIVVTKVDFSLPYTPNAR